MNTMIKLALRNIGRNKRRSLFSALALSLGVGLLLLMTGFLNGEMDSTIDTTIRLQSGHLQIRAENYNENRTSLKWQDLIENPIEMAAKIATMAPVADASPRLYLSGMVSGSDKSAGIRVYGLLPDSPSSLPYVAGIVQGSPVSVDDKDSLEMGIALAEKLGVQVGETVELSVNTSNGNVEVQNFKVKGIFDSGVVGFDKSTIVLPLAKAQSIGQAENHASLILVTLDNREDASLVKASLSAPGYQVKDWQEMNEFMMTMEGMANQYFGIIFFIVLAITATVITNTQLMAVFERTREIGILLSMGMKSARILWLFLLESAIMAVAGVVLGIGLGILANVLFGLVGFRFGDIGLTNVLLPNVIYPHLKFENIINISMYAMVITLLAGIYPASLAARMQPVEALHSSI